jgi:hypothetical protein
LDFRLLKSCLFLASLASLGRCFSCAPESVPDLAADDSPAIVSATVDYAASQISITGSHFSPAGAPPVVAFESARLTLVSFTDETAAVRLPSGWPAGSYLLAVTNSDHRTGVIRMTLAPNPVPFSKLRYHAEGLYGIWPIAGTFAYAGLLQELNAPKEWGDGMAAYGRRVASTEAGGVIHGVLAFGLDTTLHQDPRYYHSTRKGLFRRMGHAARETVLTHTDSGPETFSTWRFGSAYGEAFISNLWYPDRLDTARLGYIQGSLRMGFDMVTNLATEFWPDIKRKLHHHK